MKTEHNVRLTSGELSFLWNSYMNDSLAKCMMTYFASKVEDTQIQEIVAYALSLSKKHLDQIAKILQGENSALPQGFTSNDMNSNTSRLFSDIFYLHYIKNMARTGLKGNSLALSASTRDDVMKFYTGGLADSVELNNRSTHLLLEKGLYIRPPYIPVPNKVEFIQKKSFLGKLLDEPDRPLLASEITGIYAIIQTNGFGKALLMGFSQAAKSKEVVDYMKRGKDIATKQIEALHRFLLQDDIPTPMTWDGDISDSTDSPFSDKLMMFHVTAINAIGIGDYGDAMGISMRGDLASSYARLAAETAKYANDGVKIMIERGWMEQPPQSVDRRALTQA